MFSGEYSHSIDAKGRITIPSKYRDELGDQCVVARGFEGCLNVYSPTRWEQKIETLISTTNQAENVRKLQRQLFSKAINCEYDKQGRILVTQELRNLARLEDKIMIVGVGDHIELWNMDAWTNYIAMDDHDLADLAEEVYKLL